MLIITDLGEGILTYPFQGMIFTHVSPGWRLADPGLSYHCPLRAKILIPEGSHMSARGQRSDTPGYESELFSFPERDTYRRLPPNPL